MKINTNQVLKSLSGEVLKDRDDKGQAIDATLKVAIVNALLAPMQKEEAGTIKIKKYELAKRIYQNDEIDLTAEEITLIKARVGEVYPPLLVGQMNEILEGKSETA